jgi:hypothetical protein
MVEHYIAISKPINLQPNDEIEHCDSNYGSNCIYFEALAHREAIKKVIGYAPLMIRPISALIIRLPLFVRSRMIDNLFLEQVRM